MLQALPQKIEKKKESSLWEFRHHAADLYALFSKAWSCRCRVQHHFKLLLKHRSSAKVDFNILLLFERRHYCPAVRPWTYQHAWFEMIEVESQDIFKKKLRFEESGPRPLSRLKVPLITNFCVALKESQQASVCMGCLQEGDRCYCVYPIAFAEAVSAPGEEISLADALRPGNPEEFGMVDRWFLALTLASSVLQLYSTPWFNKEWSKQDIVFFRNGPHLAPFSWEEPYLSLDLRAESKDDAIHSITTSSAQGGLSAEERLAIILLELCFNQPLEESALYKDLLQQFGSASPVLDRVAAVMWQKKAKRHTSKEFADAINWCLEAISTTTGMSKTNWIKAFYKNVVVPLQRCHESLTVSYSKDSVDVEGEDSSTNFYSNVSKGGVSFHGPATFIGSPKIGGMHNDGK